MKRKSMLRRGLSLVLCFAMLCGMLVLGAVAEGPTYSELATGGEKIVVVGETAQEVYNVNTLGAGDEITVDFKIYMSSELAYLTNMSVAMQDAPGLTAMVPSANPYVSTVDGMQLWTPMPNGRNTMYAPLDADYGSWKNWVDKEGAGLYITFQGKYEVVDATALKSALDTNGQVTLGLDFCQKDNNLGVLEFEGFTTGGQRRDYNSSSDVKFVAPVLTAKAMYRVTYDANGGTVTAGTLPASEDKAAGTYSVPADLKLTKTVDGVKHVLSGWAIGGVAIENGQFQVVDRAVTLVAQYAPDKDGDDKPDTEEVTIKYAVNAEDADGCERLNFPPMALADGSKFYDVTLTGGSINIDIANSRALGEARPTSIDLVTYWKEAGVYIGDEKIADTVAGIPADYELADTVQKGDTVEITIKLMMDADDNGKDDRYSATVKIVEGTVNVKTIEDVKPGDPWIIYKSDADNAPTTTGTVTSPTTTINLIRGTNYDTHNGSGSPVKDYAEWEIEYKDTDNDGTKDTVVIRPVYEGMVNFKVVQDDEDGGGDVYSGQVPTEATYVLANENGVFGTPAPVTNEPVVLPKNSDMPPKNNAGDVFRNDWDWEEVKDNNGVVTRIELKPVYTPLTEDDIDIVTPDPDPGDPTKPDGVSTLTGNGYYILTSVKDDNVATVNFYAKIVDDAAKAADVDDFDVKVEHYGAFNEGELKNLTLGSYEVKYGGLSPLIGGERYGIITVEYTMVKSGIVSISLGYDDGNGNVLSPVTQEVIMVGDATKDGKVSSPDILEASRVYYGKADPAPQKASAGGDYTYELMDMDKNGTTDPATGGIKMDDVLTMARMFYGKTNPSN